MARFYVGKVVKSGGRRSKALTLYAESEAAARKAVADSKHGYGHEEIFVADIDPASAHMLDHHVDDGNGIVEHQDFPFKDNGPIDPSNLFGE